MENTNQVTVSEQSPVIKAEKTDKPPKKYNGFLRNHGKKQNKKPTPDMHLNVNKKHINRKEDIDSITPTIYEPKQTTEEYEIFNFLRLKTGHNEKKFWENLNHVLSQKSFSEIKQSNLSIVAYSVLHDSTIVFEKLLSQFGSQISQEEFINCIFKYGIHKNPLLITSCLKFYERNFSIEENFLQQIIKDFSAISYRFETNDFFLSWSSNKISPELLNVFWTESIKNKNIPIILQSLQHKPYAEYLSKNFLDYEKSLESIGRLYEIKKLLLESKNIKKVDNIKESAIINSESGLIVKKDFEPKIWLSDKNDQLKVIQENLSDKKPTEVIVKRKRKIA